MKKERRTEGWEIGEKERRKSLVRLEKHKLKSTMRLEKGRRKRTGRRGQR